MLLNWGRRLPSVPLSAKTDSESNEKPAHNSKIISSYTALDLRTPYVQKGSRRGCRDVIFFKGTVLQLIEESISTVIAVVEKSESTTPVSVDTMTGKDCNRREKLSEQEIGQGMVTSVLSL